jgi:hypothetical protein
MVGFGEFNIGLARAEPALSLTPLRLPAVVEAAITTGITTPVTPSYPYSAHRVIFQSESRPLEHGFLNSFFADLHDVLNTLALHDVLNTNT